MDCVMNTPCGIALRRMRQNSFNGRTVGSANDFVINNCQLGSEESALVKFKSTFPTLFQVMALVPSGNKLLPGPMLSQMYVAIWRH